MSMLGKNFTCLGGSVIRPVEGFNEILTSVWQDYYTANGNTWRVCITSSDEQVDRDKPKRTYGDKVQLYFPVGGPAST